MAVYVKWISSTTEKDFRIKCECYAATIDSYVFNAVLQMFFSSSAIFFCQLSGLYPYPVINIYGSPIPVVEEAKFLDLLFDKKLTFIPHIKSLKAKCLKVLDVLKALQYKLGRRLFCSS